MAKSLRKKPKPADPAPVKEPEVQAVEVVPPAPVEYKPPFLRDAYIPGPRTPEEVIHNALLRQLADDAENPPDPEPANHALELLKKVQNAKDAGQPLSVYAPEADRIFKGLEAEERLAMAVVRQMRLRQLRRQLESQEHIDRFLHRLLMRGDFTTRESLVFKQVNTADLAKTVKELMDQLEKADGTNLAREDFEKMEVQVEETTSTRQWDKTTPQGREIVRKIVLRARKLRKRQPDGT